MAFAAILTLFILQGLRGAEPWAAPDAGREGPGAGGKRRREGAVVWLGVGGGELERLLVGLRRVGGRGGQRDGPNIRAAAGEIASDSKAQPGRHGGGDRRELHHDVGLPEVQSAATEIGTAVWFFSSEEAAILIVCRINVDENFIYTMFYHIFMEATVVK